MGGRVRVVVAVVFGVFVRLLLVDEHVVVADVGGGERAALVRQLAESKLCAWNFKGARHVQPAAAGTANQEVAWVRGEEKRLIETNWGVGARGSRLLRPRATARRAG
eukprot:1329084-Pleurochrysis_carterae.AAC.1